MDWHRPGWAALLLMAGTGLWLLLGSGRVSGVDVGALGASLLILATGMALHAVSRMYWRDRSRSQRV